MANYLNLIIPFYSALLRLYPKRFRAEFKDEMRAVFSTSLEQAAKQGILRVGLYAQRPYPETRPGAVRRYDVVYGCGGSRQGDHI